jgi:hypothetical protein
VLFLCAQADEVFSINPVMANRSAPKIVRFLLILRISFLFSCPIQDAFSFPMAKKNRHRISVAGFTIRSLMPLVTTLGDQFIASTLCKLIVP